MDLVHANITLKNPRHPELRPVDARALADTGALHLCIPEHVSMDPNTADLESVASGWWPLIALLVLVAVAFTIAALPFLLGPPEPRS